jgi:hypothetical protein
MKIVSCLKDQIVRCGVPTATGVVVGMVLAKIGLGVIPLAMIGSAGVMYSRGWRIRLVRPESAPVPATPTPATGPEAPPAV